MNEYELRIALDAIEVTLDAARAALADIRRKIGRPDDYEPYPKCPPHDWTISYRGLTRCCVKCRKFEDVPAREEVAP